MKLHSVIIKAQQIALHPRTAALTEVAYASHGLLHAHQWELLAIYTALVIISLAHFFWAVGGHG